MQVFRTSVSQTGLRPFKGAAAPSTTVPAQRTQIVDRLAANSRCAFSRAELAAMSLETLTKLETSMNLAVTAGLRVYKGAK